MRVVLPFVVLLGIAACGSEPDAAGTPASRPAPAAAPAADDSVAAVAQSPGRPAVALRFALDGLPKVGSASQLRLDLGGVPGPVALRLRGEGLLLDPAAASVTIPEDGKPASQTVTLTPQAAGIAEIEVRLLPAGDDPQEVVYAIPLLVEGAAAK